jgi:hypothetical protein
MLERKTGHRHAALLLHGMATEDRVWLLSQLDAPQRASLMPLLEELAQLAIPPDAGLVTEAVQTTLAEGAFDASFDSLAAQVTALPVQKVVEILRREPHAIVSRIVSMRAWPWRHAVVMQLGEHSGVELIASRQGLSRLDRVLLESLVERAATSERQLSLPQHAFGLRSWLKRLSPLRLRSALASKA